MKRTTKQLRFAPLIRVSTEEQEKKGESLNTQKEQIIAHVKVLGGVIPDHCWQYSGQEHATPDQERELLTQLLADAERDLFDAVIVTDPSRWSRDNLKNEQGLNHLRDHSIRFFASTKEYDLYDPRDKFFLALNAAFNEMNAMEQNKKSIQNRIKRAKKGIPTGGKLPFARTYDKKKDPEEAWGIDPGKHQLIKTAADRYLGGESIVDIAASYGMNASGLHRTLCNSCGDTWTLSLNYKPLKISETITFKVPRLLPEETIEAIRKRSESGRTYHHREIKHRYLLSRMIFCDRCGYALFGYRNHSGKRYYKAVRPKARVEPCKIRKHLPSGEIETAVLLTIAQMMGDDTRIKRAVEAGMPDLKRTQALRQERDTLQRNLKKAESQLEKLVDAVANGLLSKEDIIKRREAIDTLEREASQRLKEVQQQIDSLPDPERVDRLLKWKGKVWAASSRSNPDWILEQPYETQRQLLTRAFGGKDAEGRRFGVYVWWDEETGKWSFRIHGIIVEELFTLPLDRETMMDLYGLDPAYQDVDAEIEKIRQGLTNYTKP